MLILGTLLLFLNIANGQSEDVELKSEDIDPNRDSKVLPIFQVVRFPNDICTGTSYNGTCYTAEECTTRGGTSDGSCASGFGVCCYFQLSCNSTTSENYTYLYQSSTSSLDQSCRYTVCPVSKDICRIRYDMTTMTLATPTAITASAKVAIPSSDYTQCKIDAFSISSPGNLGSPVICGTNSGYHMILDSDGTQCQVANFLIGTSTTTTRSWNIRVTQYTCAQQDEAGPPGCLQYYTQNAATFQNFGWKTSYSSGDSTVTYQHLANQHYDICIRRSSGYCYICYNVIGGGTAPVSTFSLSTSPNAAAKGSVGTVCLTDYIEIPAATSSSLAAIFVDPAFTATSDTDKICGRFFNYQNDKPTNSATVCSKQVPFRVGVHLDGWERCEGTTAILCETAILPPGLTGFKLQYWQRSC